MAKQKQSKTTKVITRRKKFIEVEIPLLKEKVEIIGNSPEEVQGKTIKLDITRILKGKGVELTLKINSAKEKAVAVPKKIRLMSYFIRRIMRKKTSYVEDSFDASSKESLLKVKPFLITRKKVSRAVRKALRNKAREWLKDYLKEKKDDEIFKELITNKIQKPLSLMLKKTYPLSLCDIRILEIKHPLPDKNPKNKTNKKESASSEPEKESKPQK